jgi:spore coat polysaccharide biosynthesis protein SpsF
METVAIVQARMGSTRLPGKVMLSLDCVPVIHHVVKRCLTAAEVDKVVVATTEKQRDDIIKRYAEREGAETFRGDEHDVLNRVYKAAKSFNADLVVRITADNPLISPEIIDATIKKIVEEGHDYVSNKVERSFPAGFDVEVFTFESFVKVEGCADTPRDREHVTTYYRQSGEFDIANLQSTEFFEEDFMQNRTDLRLTLDTPDDFELFRRVYQSVSYDQILDVQDAIKYIDENDLAGVNVD